jgi:hypothetical protein
MGGVHCICVRGKNPRPQKQVAYSHLKSGLFKTDPKTRISNQTDDMLDDGEDEGRIFFEKPTLK